MSESPRARPFRARRAGVLAAVCGAALFAATPAHAQEPLLTVGVDVTEASLTDAAYTLFVANQGSATAEGVVLTDRVPTNMTFSASDRAPLAPEAGADPCQPGSAAGTTCRWALGDLAPGTSQKVTVTYALAQSESAYPTGNPATPDGRYTFSNTASATAANGGGAPANTDSSLVRTSHELDQDAYVDADHPASNYGACNELKLRRDNAQTTFVDDDTANAATSPAGFRAGIEAFGGAELRAAVASLPSSAPTEPIPIAVHRVTSPDWDEGTGCGADGSDRQVTAAAKPQSEASPAASEPVTGPGPVDWDVSRALDTPEERDTFNGFELRAGDSIGLAGDTVTLHSSDGTPAPPPENRPRLVTVSVRVEPGRCIDSDPENATAPSDSEQRIDAYVTDLAAARVSNSAGNDGCLGAPVAEAPVGWMFDDDSPDAYISSLAGSETPREVGSAGDAGPNRASTRTDPEGRISIGIRLAGPYEEGQNAGENRVAAIALNEEHGATQDPSTVGEGGVCEPGDQPEEFLGSLISPPCGGTGEANDEDDVKMSWTPAPPDTAPPETTIDSGPEGPVRSDVSFAFSSNEARSSFECRLDDQDFGSCSSPKAYSDLAEGSHSFEVRAIDLAGNPDPTPAQRSFTVDQTPPETRIDSGPEGTVTSGEVSFAFSSNEAGSSFECRLDSQSFSSCSSPKGYSDLPEGSHTFRVRAVDAAGNPDPTSALRTFTVSGGGAGGSVEGSALAGPAARSLTLSASPGHARPAGNTTLSGALTSTAASCADAGELVRVLRRPSGGAYGDFATVTTGADGRFQLPVKVETSAEYRALAPAHGGCAEASSAPASVAVATRVIARRSDAKTRSGAPVEISGRVLPDHEGSEVVLQRRSGRRWVDVASRRLKGGPKFTFRMRAGWTGRRLFRVRWEALHEDRVLGMSRTLGIATRPEGRAPRR